MTITTTNDLVAPILQSLMPGMLSVPTPNFNYILGAEKYSMPRYGGTTARFLRPNPLNPPIVQLGNSGIEPVSQVPSRDIIDAVMAAFGTSVILNEQVVIQDQDPVLSWVTERLGVAGRQAEDIILRDYLVSAASLYNFRGGTNGDTPTNMSENDFSALNARLDTANAFKIVNGKIGEDRFGSSPVRTGYIMYCSTELEPSLDGLGKFTSNWNYPNHNDVVYCEYGSVLNTRVFTSSESSVQRGASALGADVYNNIYHGREAYAHIDQDAYSMQMIYRDPIFSGPLALNGTLGIKFMQAQAILQDTWITNARCTRVM